MNYQKRELIKIKSYFKIYYLWVIDMIKDDMYKKYIKNISDMLRAINKNNDEKIILISGASGMIGTVIIDILIYMNDFKGYKYKIYGLGRNEIRAKEMFVNYGNRKDFNFIPCDINKNNIDIGDVDYIIHAASNTHPVDYSGDPIGTITANVIGTNNLLEYAVSHGCRRFVFLSSVEIYGENKGDIERFDETYNGYINCNTLRAGYPESKRTGEALCQAYGKKYNLDFVIPRLCRVYGPTMSLRDSKAIAQFIKNAANNEDIVLKSEGKQLYSYIDVFQAAYAVLFIMLRGENGNAYNISADSGEWCMRELADRIASHADKKVVFDLPDEKEKAGFSTATKALLDNNKLKKLGWQECFECNEILDYTIDIVKARMMR